MKIHPHPDKRSSLAKGCQHYPHPDKRDFGTSSRTGRAAWRIWIPISRADHFDGSVEKKTFIMLDHFDGSVKKVSIQLEHSVTVSILSGFLLILLVETFATKFLGGHHHHGHSHGHSNENRQTYGTNGHNYGYSHNESNGNGHISNGKIMEVKIYTR